MAEDMLTSSKLGLGSSEPVSEFVGHESCTGGEVATIVRPPGLWGDRQPRNIRTRLSPKSTDLTVVCWPNAAELDIWLPKLLGGTKGVDNVFAVGQTIAAFYLWQIRGTYIHKFAGCKISTMTLEASDGQPLKATFTIPAVTENKAALAGTFPAGWALDTGSTHYMFADLVVDIGGTEYSCRQFRLVYDNMLNTTRFTNADYRTGMPTRGMQGTWEILIPTNGSVALMDTDPSGVEVTATFTQDAKSLEIYSPAVAFDKQALTAQDDEWHVPLRGMASKTDADPAVRFTNVSA